MQVCRGGSAEGSKPLLVFQRADARGRSRRSASRRRAHRERRERAEPVRPGQGVIGRGRTRDPARSPGHGPTRQRKSHSLGAQAPIRRIAALRTRPSQQARPASCSSAARTALANRWRFASAATHATAATTDPANRAERQRFAPTLSAIGQLHRLARNPDRTGDAIPLRSAATLRSRPGCDLERSTRGGRFA